MHEPHETADAIDRLDDMQDILRELSIYREARDVVLGLVYDVNSIRVRLAVQYPPATPKQLRWVRKLEQRVHGVDAVFRPLG